MSSRAAVRGRQWRVPLGTSPALAAQGDEEVVRILREAEQTALKTLGEHRAALDALATALVERQTVDKSEVDAIVADTEKVPAGR